MSIDLGPVIKSLDHSDTTTTGLIQEKDLYYRKYGRYLHYPVYDQIRGTLLGYPVDFYRFFDKFITNYPCITNHLTNFSNGSSVQTTHPFTSLGRMAKTGEYYYCDINWSDGSPWTIKTGVSFSSVVFDAYTWSNAGRPSIPSFTATVTSVSGSNVVVTIGTTVYNTVLSGVFIHAQYFTFTMASSVVAGNTCVVNINQTASAFTGSYSTPAYQIYKLNTTSSALIAETPVYVSGPLSFAIFPGLNIVSIDSIGPVFKDSLNVNKNFPCTSFIANGLYTFVSTRSAVTDFTDRFMRTFGDPTSYPVFTPSSNKNQEFAWMTQANINLLFSKQFKDCFQTQYTKRYIDMSYTDVKALCSFKDTQTMSVEFPKYDANGVLLNNPKFSASTGKQVGGTYLVKKQPLYDASLISERKKVQCLINNNTIVDMDLSLSLLKGESVSSGQIVFPNSIDKFVVQPRGWAYHLNTPGPFGLWSHIQSTIMAGPSEEYGASYANNLFGISSGRFTSMSSYYDWWHNALTSPPNSYYDNFPPSNPGNYTVVGQNSSGWTGRFDDCLDISVLPQQSSWDTTFSHTLLLKADGLYWLQKSSVDNTLFWQTLAIPGVYGTPICFYESSNSYTTRLSVITTTHLLLYEAIPITIAMVAPLTGTGHFYNITLASAIELPNTITGHKTIRQIDGHPLFVDDSNQYSTCRTSGAYNTVHALRQMTPMGVYANKVKLISMYYNSLYHTVDTNCTLKIRNIPSAHFRNSYFDSYYGFYKMSKLVSVDNLSDDEVISTIPSYNFDKTDNTKSYLYRSVLTKNASVSQLQKINVNTNTIDASIDLPTVDFFIVSSKGANTIVYSGATSKIFENLNWGAKTTEASVYHSNTDSLLNSWVYNLNGACFLYFKRGGSWVKTGTELVCFKFNYCSLDTHSINVSAQGSSALSMVLAGDSVYLFRSAVSDEVLLTSNIKLPMIIRSMTDNVSNHGYILYGYVFNSSMYLMKMNLTKFWANDSTYPIQTTDISSPCSTIDEISLFDNLFYNPSNNNLFLQVNTAASTTSNLQTYYYPLTRNVYNVDTGTLVPTLAKNLSYSVFNLMYDSTSSSVIHVTYRYGTGVTDDPAGIPREYNFSESFGPVVGQSFKPSDYYLPVDTDCVLSPPTTTTLIRQFCDNVVIGFCYKTGTIAEIQDITIAGITDVISDYKNFSGVHSMETKSVVFNSSDILTIHMNLAKTQILFCTKKIGGLIYNYYLLDDFRVSPQGTVDTSKSYLTYLTSTNSPSTYGVNAYATVISNIISVTNPQSGLGAPTWMLPFSIDLSFMTEETVINMCNTGFRFSTNYQFV